MDIWMVVVAACAGCIAKHFQNSKPSSESLSPKQPPVKRWPFRRWEKREKMKPDDSEHKNEVSRGVSSAEAPSTSQFDHENEVNLEGNNVFSMSSVFPGFSGSDVEMVRVVSEGLSPRNRSILRSRRNTGRASRPLSALESSLMAQLYTEHVERNEYLSIQTVRPFLVTDGNQVINNSAGKRLHTYSDEKGEEKTAIQEHFNLQRGSSDATLLLCLGISFGIISSFMASRQEVEKLNRLLKQTEGLVQDLHEELEMKDSLVMQELKVEDHNSQQTDSGFFNDGLPHLVSYDHKNKEAVNQKAKDDSFRKIEAELEAELEMLELNMGSSTLERKISNLVELDPDFEPDVAQGELRADMLDREDGDQANTNRDRSRSTTTPCSANYAVCPRELSLRLYEVLQSQLEERIRELEAEIENKRNQTHKSWKDILSSEEGDDEKPVDEPVVLNLSGEALDAYNEACNEFANLDESDDDDNDDDGDFGDDDEMEKLLIRHIVEKARQGSPVVLNAQRVLFSE